MVANIQELVWVRHSMTGSLKRAGANQVGSITGIKRAEGEAMRGMNGEGTRESGEEALQDRIAGIGEGATIIGDIAVAQVSNREAAAIRRMIRGEEEVIREIAGGGLHIIGRGPAISRVC